MNFEMLVWSAGDAMSGARRGRETGNRMREWERGEMVVCGGWRWCAGVGGGERAINGKLVEEDNRC